ncbi:MAG TPA: luciferase family protein [Terriglobales bacterium]|nr:luciferase family protein [Terriglobales bacterium]
MIGVKKVEAEISSWAGVLSYPHRFGGREFRLGNAEIGHIHPGGVVDIPFTRPLREELLAKGLAEQHRWVPDSGWTTFRVRRESDLPHALWLLRLSYLRYAMKSAKDPIVLFESESEHLGLSERMKSLLEPFLPKTSRHSLRQPISA